MRKKKKNLESPRVIIHEFLNLILLHYLRTLLLLKQKLYSHQTSKKVMYILVNVQYGFDKLMSQDFWTVVSLTSVEIFFFLSDHLSVVLHCTVFT